MVARELADDAPGRREWAASNMEGVADAELRGERLAYEASAGLRQPVSAAPVSRDISLLPACGDPRPPARPLVQSACGVADPAGAREV